MVQKIDRADIIQAGDVIIVFVREENGMNILNLVVEHLSPEIRANIDGKPYRSGLNKSCCSKPAVTRIIRCAYLATATNNGYAL